MDMIFRLLLLVVSLIALSFTGYWFVLALTDRPRFHRLMEERSWPKISENAQFISAMVLFPIMVIGVFLLIFDFFLVK